ncbi:MAG: hypothetical protein GF408_01850 [Candidatus Omnitrophica bacterium]|nr:hypothetical protein [Candidatus Omnitrophota bacterium]
MKIVSRGNENELSVSFISSGGAEVRFSGYPYPRGAREDGVPLFVSRVSPAGCPPGRFDGPEELFAPYPAAAPIYMDFILNRGLRPKRSGVAAITDKDLIRKGDISVRLAGCRWGDRAFSYEISAGNKTLIYRDIGTDPRRDENPGITILGGSPGSSFQAEKILTTLEEAMRGKKRTVFLLHSGRDIQAATAGFLACEKTGSMFVPDLHTAFLAETVRRSPMRTPFPGSSSLIRIKFSREQADELKNKGYGPLLMSYSRYRTDRFGIEPLKCSALVVTGDTAMITDLAKKTRRETLLLDLRTGENTRPLPEKIKNTLKPIDLRPSFHGLPGDRSGIRAPGPGKELEL